MREKKVKGAMFEAVAIVEDYRAQCLAGFETALQLWELAIIPSLLYSCGVWTEIPSKTLQKLEDLQLFFLRLILRVGPGTPKVALLAQTGMMKMKHRIWIEKVMMIVHIRGLNETALARQIWKEQREQNWPGLSKEVSQICEELGIPDVNESAMVDNKKSVRRMVKSACRSKNDIELKEKMDDLIKCDNMKGEDCDLKSYFRDLNLNDARNMFAINSNMNDLRGNYSKVPANIKNNWRCIGCNVEVEINSHIMVCNAYEVERSRVDMGTDKGVVDFFRGVMKKRMEFLDKREQR